MNDQATPIRAATTDVYSGPAEGEKAFVDELCGVLAAEFGGRAALDDATRENRDGAVRFTIVAREAVAGTPALNAKTIGELLRTKAHEARKLELTTGPLFGRDQAGAAA